MISSVNDINNINNLHEELKRKNPERMQLINESVFFQHDNFRSALIYIKQ